MGYEAGEYAWDRLWGFGGNSVGSGEIEGR